MKVNYLLAILLLSISCNSEKVKNNITSDFKEFEKLNAIQVYDIEFYNTNKILVYDSLLITQESTTPSYFYNVYNLNNDDKVNSFFSFGHGNNETTQALNIDYYNADTIQVYSYPHLLSLFSIDDIVINGNTQPVAKEDFSKLNIEPFVAMHLIRGNDFITCAENIEIDDNARFCRYDYESKQMIYFGKYPENDFKLKEFPIENYYRLYAYQGLFRIKPDKSRAMFARFQGIGFDIVDLTDNKIITSQTYEYPDCYLEHISQFNISMVKATEKNIDLASSVCSDDYFYLAYTEIEMTTEGAKQNKEEVKSYLFCFDWNGNPIKGYVVDDNIKTLGIDANNGFLYCIIIDANKNQVLKKYKV